MWTGNELVIWGGETESETEWSNAGGAYDPVSNTWRNLAASPLPPMSGHSMVDTGTGIFICCGRNQTGWQNLAAIYNPAADEWTATAPPPSGETRVTPVWTGEEILLPQRAARYDPISDQWTTMSPAPATIVAAAQAFWTGTQLIVWNSQFRGGDMLLYDPEADSWDRLPRLPAEAPVWGGRMVWTGTDLIVWGDQQTNNGQAVGWAMNFDDRAWRRIAPAPGDAASWWEGTPGSNSAVWTGSQMLVWAGELRVAPDGTTAVLAYDPSTDTWEQLPPAPSRWYTPSIVWAGDQLIVGTDPLLIHSE